MAEAIRSYGNMRVMRHAVTKRETHHQGVLMIWHPSFGAILFPPLGRGAMNRSLWFVLLLLPLFGCETRQATNGSDQNASARVSTNKTVTLRVTGFRKSNSGAT